jgi:hypothetical protein
LLLIKYRVLTVVSFPLVRVPRTSITVVIFFQSCFPLRNPLSVTVRYPSAVSTLH